jgi:hypothetical protein
MYKLLIISIFAISFSFSHAQSVEKIWETGKVFDIPESVLFDDSICYISCVAGYPTTKNDSGYIAKISSNGDIIDKYWIENLNAPKGMGVFDELLYVTDIDQLVIINRFSGELLEKIDVPGAKFLNDIDISPNGVVAFSDMMDKAVYLYKNNSVELLIKNEELNYVNGINWNVNGLFAGMNGAVIKIDTTAKTYKKFIVVKGGIDGLEQIDETTMLISDWAGKVQVVSTNADAVELLNFTDEKYNAADIDFCPKQSVIYIPTFFGNTVAAYQLIW